MQPGRRRASLFLALLGLSMVPLIVAPPEKGTEATGDEIVEETINTSAEPEDEYSTGYWMKRSFESGQKELQQAIDNMSTGQQFPVSHYDSVSERTERMLREAQQMLKEIKSYKKRFWLESFAYFLENMLNKVKPDRKYKKSNTSIENVRESFVTEENSLSFSGSPMPLVTANFEHRESNMQAFATVPPQLEKYTVATLPAKSNSTQSDKVTITALSEFVDHSLHSPTIMSLETSNLQESQAVPESPTPNKAQEPQAIRISTDTYSPRESHDITVSFEANSPQLSQAIRVSTETYIPQESRDTSPSSEASVPQESRDTSISSEASVPQESQAVYLSSETKNPQETHETSEIYTSQKSRSMPESSENSSNLNQKSSFKLQSLEQEHSSPYIATPQRIVPETNQLQVDDNLTYNDDQTNFPAVARVFPVLDNLGKLQIYTKTKVINNHIEEIDYIDELEKELLEIARLQALERSKNTSTSISSTDMSPPTTAIKRNSFELIDEKSESTVGGNIQKSPTLPQSSNESPLMTDETTPDHAVPETNHQQTVQLTPDAQSALPKKEQAIPIHDDQEVTTTVFLQNNNAKPDEELKKEEVQEVEEEDELVRELEELPRLAALERARSTPIPFVNPIDASTPETVKRSSFVTDYQATNEDEKRRIEINMAKEIRELHRLGAKQEEIIKALGVNSLQSPDGQESVKMGQDAEIHKVQDSNTDETIIYKINPNTWKPFGYPYPPKPYTNDSYEGMHINMPPMKERIVTNQLQGGYRWAPYNARMRTDSRNIQNTLRKLQRENYLLKTRLMSYTQTNPNINKIRGVTYSGPNRLNQFLPHETRYPTELSLGQNVPNPGGTHIYTPYPYITNSDPKNFTLQEDMGKTSPLVSKPLPQNTNSEFSDEMKRELRDGKVILLSDSVVRSNFEPEKEKDEGGKETKVIPEEGETGIQAQN